jgi:hypothetical protein
MLIQAGVTGLGTAAGLAAFAVMSKKRKKAYVPALVGGGVAAAVSLLWNLADTYVIEKELGIAANATDELIKSGKMDDVVKLISGGMSGLGMTYAQRKRLGLLNVQKVGLIDAQRMGLYTPEPTVRKFNTTPATRYFS